MPLGEVSKSDRIFWYVKLFVIYWLVIKRCSLRTKILAYAEKEWGNISTKRQNQ